MVDLALSLLGPFSALLDDHPLHNFKTNKVQALLIYLAMERGRSHRRESLMTLLWPDMPLESAQVNLRQTIYRLRQTFSSSVGENAVEVILTDRQSVKLNPEVAIDLDINAFQSQLDQDPASAVKYYRGDFLSDFYLVDSNEFEDWAAQIRENLRRQALDALANLAETQLQAENYAEAHKYAWRQLEIDKLRESAYRQLMMALAKDGQRSAALSQFRICRDRLQEHLGVDPSQETIDLYKKIQDDTIQRTKVIEPRPIPEKRSDMPVFVLTDIEGSTRLWDTHHQAMLPALLKHNSILETQITKFGGRILELRGDGVKAVFESGDPLGCMVAIQKELGTEEWGEIGELKIRIGLHGVPSVRKGYDFFKEDDQYYGPVLNHTARVMDAGWGGQILVSERVRNGYSLPDGATWQDFGRHTVKSLDEDIHILGYFILIYPTRPSRHFAP